MIQNQLRCLFDGHDQSPILGCCKCISCQHLKPYCQYCIIDFHAEHLKQLQPLFKINESIQNRVASKSRFTKSILELKLLASFLDDLITPLFINLDQDFSEVNITQLNTMIIKLMKIDMIEMELLPKLNDLLPKLDILRKECKSIYQCWAIEKHNQNTVQQLQVEKKQRVEQIKVFTEVDKDLKKNTKLDTQRSQIIFSKQNINRFNRIKVENDGKTVKVGPETSGLIFCEPEIPIDINSRFAFQIQKHKWVCIGVCHKSIIIKQRKVINLSKIGHGTYLIENSGFTYSHLDRELNNTEQSFKFTNNDIIIVDINMTDKKIIWRKFSTNQILQKMNIDTNLDLYPCVHIFNSKIIIVDEY